MAITMRTTGLNTTIAKFQVSNERLMHLKPVMENVLNDMMKVEREMFHAQGARGQTAWPKLQASTVRKKGFSTILIDTGLLLQSLTIRGATYQVAETTDNRARLGTKRPFSGMHQKGKGKMPERRFMLFLESDHVRWDIWIRNYVNQPFRRRRNG